MEDLARSLTDAELRRVLLVAATMPDREREAILAAVRDEQRRRRLRPSTLRRVSFRFAPQQPTLTGF